MSIYLSEEFLYKHIPRAEMKTIDAIPGEKELNHIFSGRFCRKMNVLIKYERQGAFVRVTARLGRVVAAVLVVVFLLNMALVIGVKAYREKFFEIIKTVTEEFTSFLVGIDDGNDVNGVLPVGFSCVPDGFEVVEQYGNTINSTTIYQNGEGQEIYYMQSNVVNGEMHIDTENAIVQPVLIENCEVLSVLKNGTTQLYWLYGENKFLIISNIDYDTVVALAEDVIKQLAN